MRALLPVAGGIALGISLCFVVAAVGTLDHRVWRLEQRGWVPVDDVATVGDLIRLEARLCGDALEAQDDDGAS